MILDSHTHIGKRTVIGSAADLLKSMNVAGIDKSLVFAGKLNDKATEELLKDIEPYKGRLYGIGAVSARDDFAYDFVPKIEKLLDANEIYGLKVYTGYEWYYPIDYKSYMEPLIKYNKPVIFHSGDCVSSAKGSKLKYAHPLAIDDLAVEMPDLKIIIAHMGYPWVIDCAEVCYRHKNVYADMSGFVYGGFNDNDAENYKKAISDFTRICGPEKLVFGTDWPISNQKSYVETIYGMLGQWVSEGRITGDECNKIMGLRACELFGIN